MRIEGGKKLRHQLKSLKGKARDHVVRAIARNTKEGVRVAKVLAPERTGQTKRDITARFYDGGMTGVVQAIDPDADRPAKDRAYSIEHGRKKGEHGTTAGAHHMHRTRQFLAKKHKRSIKSAVNRAAKEAANA